MGNPDPGFTLSDLEKCDSKREGHFSKHASNSDRRWLRECRCLSSPSLQAPQLKLLKIHRNFLQHPQSISLQLLTNYSRFCIQTALPSLTFQKHLNRSTIPNWTNAPSPKFSCISLPSRQPSPDFPSRPSRPPYSRWPEIFPFLNEAERECDSRVRSSGCGFAGRRKTLQCVIGRVGSLLGIRHG